MYISDHFSRFKSYFADFSRKTKLTMKFILQFNITENYLNHSSESCKSHFESYDLSILNYYSKENFEM